MPVELTLYLPPTQSSPQLRDKPKTETVVEHSCNTKEADLVIRHPPRSTTPFERARKCHIWACGI